jgi:hypothetical protein
MVALVVCESLFGNTRAVADAIADGLRGAGVPTAVVEVRSAPDTLADVDLLVVGGPTHAFGMTRATTRHSAVEQGAPALSAERGVREWLADVRLPRGLAVAAFDTRVKVRGMPGSAAKGIVRRLRSQGARVVRPPESFWVDGTPGPLTEGEVARARSWAADLGSHRRAA